MANKIEIIDNFLPIEEFKRLQGELLSGAFPWYLGTVLDTSKATEADLKAAKVNQKYNFQVHHSIYRDFAPQSKAMDVVTPILNKLNPLAILRIKANLTFRTSEVIEQGYHTDFSDEVSCTTGVFYVNNTDGYTKFLTGEVVESVENRLVLFDSRLLHTGTTCTDSDIRCVINFNIIPKA
jgi:hypothetical protein